MLRRSRGKSPEKSESEGSAQESEEEQEQIVPKKRGRKPIEPKWTRVLKFSELMDDEPPLYPLMKDLNQMREEIEDEEEKPRIGKGLILTHDGYTKDEWKLKLEDHQFNSKQLEVFASRLITIRKRFQEKAKLLEESLLSGVPEDEDEVAP